MNERRNFIKGFGLLGAVIAGAASAKEALQSYSVPVDISNLAPENPTTLVLCGQRKINDEKSSSLYTGYNTEYKNKVELSVGKDNRLWTRVNGQWKRLVIE